MNQIASCPESAHDEPVDARRNQFHASFVTPILLGDRLTSQSYRPEIVSALSELHRKHKCDPLSRLAQNRIRQGITPEYGADGPTCLKLKDVRHVLVNPDSTTRVSADFAKLHSDNLVSSDAVFINRSGGFTVGRAGVYLRSTPVFVSDDVFTFIPADKCDAAFIAGYLNSWWGKRALEAGINGSTGQLKLPQGHVENIPIPRVHPSIQWALGAKVRQADRLRQLAAKAQQRSLDLLEHYLPTPESNAGSLFNSVAAKDLSPARLDAKHYAKHFIEARRRVSALANGRTLGDEVASVCNGFEHRSFVDTGRPYLCVSDISRCDLLLSQSQRIPDAVTVPKKAIICPGDVLIVRTGSLGQAAEVLEEDCNDGTSISSHFVRLKLKDKSRAGFIAAFLSYGCGELLQWQIAYGAVQLQVSQDELLAIPIPNLNSDVEKEIGDGFRSWRRFRREVGVLIHESHQDIHRFLNGDMNNETLLAAGATAAAWLNSHTCPDSHGSP